MVVTVAIVVLTNNLALGVAGGVLLAAIFFARRVAHVTDVTSIVDPEDGRTADLPRHRRAVLRLDQRVDPPVRLRR